MKLVISGASGQLGRRVAELVLGTAAPADLILTTRTPEALASFAARGVAVRHADFAAPGDTPCGVCGRRAAAARQRHGSRAAHRAAPKCDRRGQGRRRSPCHLHVGAEARTAEPRGRGAEPPCDGAGARAQRPRLDRAAQQPVRRLPATGSAARARDGSARAQPRQRQSGVRGSRGLRGRCGRRAARRRPRACRLRAHGQRDVHGRRARGALRRARRASSCARARSTTPSSSRR